MRWYEYNEVEGTEEPAEIGLKHSSALHWQEKSEWERTEKRIINMRTDYKEGGLLFARNAVEERKNGNVWLNKLYSVIKMRTTICCLHFSV